MVTKCFQLVLLGSVLILLTPSLGIEITSRLTRVALSPTNSSYSFSDSTNCQFASTQTYFGLLCNGQYFHSFLPSQLSGISQDTNLISIQTIGNSLFYQDATWAFSSKLIMRSSLYWQNYRILEVDEHSFSQSYYYHYITRVDPLFSALTDSFSMTMEVSGDFNLGIYLFYHKSQSPFSIERDRLKQLSDIKPDALIVHQIEWGRNRVYTTYSPAQFVFIKVDEAGQYPTYSNLAYIQMTNNNCASVLAASDDYLAVGCPQANIISIYTTISYEQICSFSGKNGTVLGSQLVIYQDKDINGAQTGISTLFVTGSDFSSNLHFVTHVKIVPETIYNQAYCFVMNNQSDYIVSHTLSSGYRSNYLQIGITQNYLLVYLKNPSAIYNYDKKRGLYFGLLKQFAIHYPRVCPFMHYSTSPIYQGPCLPCSESVNATAYPQLAMIKEKSCCATDQGQGPQCLNCTQYIQKATLPQNSQWINNGTYCATQCLPGFSIFKPTGFCQNDTLLACLTPSECICNQYMEILQIKLPQNSEWMINEEHNCMSRCISNYSLFSATGLCEPNQFLNQILSDTCFSQNTCQVCNIQSCYFSGGTCQPGSIDRIQNMYSIHKQCSRNESFCGEYQILLDFDSSQNFLNLTPRGYNDFKAKTGILCDWKIKVINQRDSVEIAKNSRSIDDAFIIEKSGMFQLIYDEQPKIYNISRGLSQLKSQFIVGIVFYQDSMVSTNLLIKFHQSQVA